MLFSRNVYGELWNFSPCGRKACSHILRLWLWNSLFLVVATETRGCMISYHGAFVHFVPSPSSARTASGLKIDISFGPNSQRGQYVTQPNTLGYQNRPSVPVRTKSPYWSCRSSIILKLVDFEALTTFHSFDTFAKRGPGKSCRRWKNTRYTITLPKSIIP